MRPPPYLPPRPSASSQYQAPCVISLSASPDALVRDQGQAIDSEEGPQRAWKSTGRPSPSFPILPRPRTACREPSPPSVIERTPLQPCYSRWPILRPPSTRIYLTLAATMVVASSPNHCLLQGRRWDMGGEKKVLWPCADIPERYSAPRRRGKGKLPRRVTRGDYVTYHAKAF